MKKSAFTMAEILISLTIIGVIAAITLPALQANINEKTWATQKKTLYSRRRQAISMLPSVNGFGIGADDAETTTKAAQAFITDGLSKVLEINNICDNQHLKDCGIVSKYKNTNGQTNSFPTTMRTLHQCLGGSHSYSHTLVSTAHDKYSLVNTNVAAFETKNGESIAVFYQPNCRYSFDWSNSSNSYLFVYAAPYMCANFIYDLNGKKGPNTTGKDIGFMTVFYPTDSEVVMPIPLNKDSATEQTYADALKVCSSVGSDVRLPNKEELAALGFNERLFNMGISVGVSKYYATTNNFKLVNSNGLAWSNMNYNLAVRCIKR